MDNLTGVRNCVRFFHDAQSRIEMGKPFCLIYMDLNDFKSVNDHWGHLAGGFQGCSTGYACFPQDCRSLDAPILLADKKMYESKQKVVKP